jgi:hypothetical protein
LSFSSAAPAALTTLERATAKVESLKVAQLKDALDKYKPNYTKIDDEGKKPAWRSFRRNFWPARAA